METLIFAISSGEASEMMAPSLFTLLFCGCAGFFLAYLLWGTRSADVEDANAMTESLLRKSESLRAENNTMLKQIDRL